MRGRRGQGIVEYVLVVGLVGLALVGAVKVFRVAVDRTYGRATAALEGVAGGMGAPARAEVGVGVPRTASKPMRLRQECLHPRRDADDVCVRCGEAL